ncbi:caspase domain-containing protein [Mycena polygramma]|nr:caspase domain-containing protein [Mycena polygramma]
MPTQSRVFALIIGIDQYQTLPNLRGCVNDAKDFKAFLTHSLRVPDGHIEVLTNKNATRARILSTFRTHLISNASIRAGGDTLVFFYAGHGSRVDAPNWLHTTSGRVETICPQDEGCVDEKGRAVPGIPDYTIHTLLQKLAAAKGNNLTAIFDSCNSGGIGRGHGRLVPRCVESTVPLPDDLDSDIIGEDLMSAREGKATLPEGFRYPFMESHILLAACRDTQTAFETTFKDAWRGRFSESLIRSLRTISLEQTTYVELMKLIEPWTGQNPQVEGKYKERRLFDGRSPRVLGKSLPLTPTSIPGAPSFEIKMGSVEGVVAGTEFLVSDGTRKIILYAQHVDLNRSFLVAKDKNENPAKQNRLTATVWDWKNNGTSLGIYLPRRADLFVFSALFPDNSSVTSALFPTRRLAWSKLDSLPTPRNFVQVSSRSASDVELKGPSNGAFAIQWLRGMIKELAPSAATTQFYLNCHEYHRLPGIMDDIAHFNYFLKRHGGGQIPAVSLEMHTLTGPDLQRELSADIFHHHVAQVKKAEKYGFTVCNRSPHALFVYLFYFDPADYVIQAWYSPATPDSPLSASRDGTHATRLPIGYGSGGYAFQFFPTKGKSTETGFLKVFVSTEYLDMGWIEQKSPFKAELQPMGRPKGRRETPETGQLWDAFHAVVTMSS